jgi:hypothetical protein
MAQGRGTCEALAGPTEVFAGDEQALLPPFLHQRLEMLGREGQPR